MDKDVFQEHVRLSRLAFAGKERDFQEWIRYSRERCETDKSYYESIVAHVQWCTERANWTVFEYRVEFIRKNFFDYHSEQRETPAKVFAYHYKILPESARAEYLRKLISDSKKTKLAYDSLIEIAHDLHRVNKPWPTELQAWILNAVVHPDQRPTTGAQVYRIRDFRVCGAIQYVVGWDGLEKPTRNISKIVDGKQTKLEHCCREGESPCDVVGIAAGIHGYKTVEGIWGELGENFVLTKVQKN